MCSYFPGAYRPTTALERGYGVLLAFVGLVFQAIALGQIAVIFNQMNAEQMRFREKMSNINMSMDHMQLDETTQDRVRQYFEYSYWIYGAENPETTWMQEVGTV